MFAAAYQQVVGARSFDDLSKSLIFDGAYRLTLGQVPFRDFYSPVGPVKFWLQALFFRLFGIANLSGIYLSCVMNAAAAGIVMRIGWRESRNAALAAAAGLATAIWFVPLDPDAPGYNSFAFFFLFAALGAWPGESRGGLSRAALAGAAAAAAFYSKQSIGLVGAAGLALYAAWTGGRRRTAGFIVGGAAALLLLTLHIGSADWENFTRYFVVLPAGYGQLHVRMPLRYIAGHLQSPFILLLPLAALSIMVHRRDKALMTVLTLIQFSACLLSSGWAYLYLPFIGLQFLLAAKGWLEWQSADAHQARLRSLWGSALPWGKIFVMAAFALLAFLGLRRGLWRFVPGLATIPAFETSVGLVFLIIGGVNARAVAMKRLAVAGWISAAVGVLILGHAAESYRSNERRLGDLPALEYREVRVPTLKGLEIAAPEARNIEDVVEYLEKLPPQGRPFFADIPLFHVLLRQPSPQPFVWFLKGLTHREGEPDESRICGSLRRNGVRTMVLAWDSDVTAGSLPCVQRWLQDEFAPDRKIGDYLIYRRRDR